MDTLFCNALGSFRDLYIISLVHSYILATLNDQLKNKWDKNYQACTSAFPSAAKVLQDNQHLLPNTGTALDLACGRGANAICLAENGLNTSAWDISSIALEHLSNKAKEKNLQINTEVRDVSQKPPTSNSFDIIIISNFLERDIIDDIKNAIKTDGLIFYQTFIRDRVKDTGPSNPDYLLKENELLNLFHDWQTR